jgi:hypothetical protein
MPHVLIIGAGITGFLVAQGLKKVGFLHSNYFPKHGTQLLTVQLGRYTLHNLRRRKSRHQQTPRMDTSSPLVPSLRGETPFYRSLRPHLRSSNRPQSFRYHSWRSNSASQERHWRGPENYQRTWYEARVAEETACAVWGGH